MTKFQLCQLALLSFFILACFYVQVDAKKKQAKPSASVSTILPHSSPETNDKVTDKKPTLSNVIELNAENWNKTLDGSKAAVVMFYLSWCE